MTDEPIPFINRLQLAKFITDPSTLLMFENLQRQVAEIQPSQINDAFDAATGAQISADDAQADASSALSLATTLQGPSYVTLAASAVLTNERVLTGGTGVTLPVAAGTVTITVNVPTALGYTPANKAGDTFTGGVSGTTFTASGLVQCASLRINQAPTTAAIVQTDWVPININGVTYKLLLGT